VEVARRVATHPVSDDPRRVASPPLESERMMRRYAAVTDETLRRAAEAVAGNGHGTV
jgi:hypothetical protein